MFFAIAQNLFSQKIKVENHEKQIEKEILDSILNFPEVEDFLEAAKKDKKYKAKIMISFEHRPAESDKKYKVAVKVLFREDGVQKMDTTDRFVFYIDSASREIYYYHPDFEKIISVKEWRKKCVAVYGICMKRFMAYSQLQLYEDSTFVFGDFMDVGGWNFKFGKWKLDDEILTLNTFNKPDVVNESLFTITTIGLKDITRKGMIIRLDSNCGVNSTYLVKSLDDSTYYELSDLKPLIFNNLVTRLLVSVHDNQGGTSGRIIFLDTTKNDFTITYKTQSLYDRTDYFYDLKLKYNSLGVYTNPLFINNKERSSVILLKKGSIEDRVF